MLLPGCIPPIKTASLLRRPTIVLLVLRVRSTLVLPLIAQTGFTARPGLISISILCSGFGPVLIVWRGPALILALIPLIARRALPVVVDCRRGSGHILIGSAFSSAIGILLDRAFIFGPAVGLAHSSLVRSGFRRSLVLPPCLTLGMGLRRTRTRLIIIRSIIGARRIGMWHVRLRYLALGRLARRLRTLLILSWLCVIGCFGDLGFRLRHTGHTRSDRIRTVIDRCLSWSGSNSSRWLFHRRSLLLSGRFSLKKLPFDFFSRQRPIGIGDAWLFLSRGKCLPCLIDEFIFNRAHVIADVSP
ncbi:hypothetical protein EDC14_105323 [Hydrogenispora ethanolica]|uniref:Uncharacterized protein n=1 Tax=Hydrogenispora ethanolica TaxID=1082276 RepID=A0A4R1QPW3_HYDET|nr:hypothetical protein EDC14_105323 [Hydrogenispora ethanolica]